MEQTFTKENVDNLSITCNKIQSILDEAVDGQLWGTQLMFLGSLIEDFTKNPIVANSGIITPKVK